MLNFILGVLFGAAVMDFIWAWKFGIPQIFWSRLRLSVKRLVGRIRY